MNHPCAAQVPRAGAARPARGRPRVPPGELRGRRERRRGRHHPPSRGRRRRRDAERVPGGRVPGQRGARRRRFGPRRGPLRNGFGAGLGQRRGGRPGEERPSGLRRVRDARAERRRGAGGGDHGLRRRGARRPGGRRRLGAARVLRRPLRHRPPGVAHARRVYQRVRRAGQARPAQGPRRRLGRVFPVDARPLPGGLRRRARRRPRDLRGLRAPRPLRRRCVAVFFVASRETVP